jgi:hypothetical protein
VEALPPSKSVCSILPTARNLRAGAGTLYPARAFKARYALRASLVSTLASPACQHFSFFVF